MNNLAWLVVLIVVCVAFGWWRLHRDGKAVKLANQMQLSAAEIGQTIDQDVTLLQFSSAFCAPCRTTRAILERTAQSVPGVSHIDIDAELNLELVRKLDIRRTPTTLLLDRSGTVRNRVVGVPQSDQLLAAIAAVADK